MRQSVGICMGLLLVCAATCSNALAAGNPLGFYTGVGLGVGLPQGNQSNPFGAEPFFRSSNLGWDALVGVRPIRWLGAELQYMDLGYSSLTSRGCYFSSCAVAHSIRPSYPYTLSIQGGHSFAGAAFAVVYLPLPFMPSWLDLFGKVGTAWLWAPYTSLASVPSLGLRFLGGSPDHEGNDLAYGGGMQIHFGAFAFRTEYQVIDAIIGNPALLTVGVTWTP